ncbi:hypothetical protein FQN54_008622 [Arachnomyces sp. PD_36]|nr:hypothetical protein FQN54_008622 [Arachnomyces sp. PD_36]
MSSTEQKKPTVVCVFCASVTGNTEAHIQSAKDLALAFHKENITLVYGGGTSGMMGTMARELVKLSGPKAVHGIIPRALIRVEDGYKSKPLPGDNEAEAGMGGKAPEREVVTTGKEGDDDISHLLQETEYGMTTVVADMHTRKRLMAQKVIEGGPGSGFVGLAGGYGTMEEIMEMVTWNQLGIHHRGIVILNINGYWDGLLTWVRKSVEEGYVSGPNGGILVETKAVGEVLPALREYQISPGRHALDWEKK